MTALTAPLYLGAIATAVGAGSTSLVACFQPTDVATALPQIGDFHYMSQFLGYDPSEAAGETPVYVTSQPSLVRQGYTPNPTLTPVTHPTASGVSIRVAAMEVLGGQGTRLYVVDEAAGGKFAYVSWLPYIAGGTPLAWYGPLPAAINVERPALASTVETSPSTPTIFWYP